MFYFSSQTAQSSLGPAGRQSELRYNHQLYSDDVNRYIGGLAC